MDLEESGLHRILGSLSARPFGTRVLAMLRKKGVKVLSRGRDARWQRMKK